MAFINCSGVQSMRFTSYANSGSFAVENLAASLRSSSAWVSQLAADWRALEARARHCAISRW